MNPQEAVIALLVAAMKDAVLEHKLTQFKARINPDGKSVRFVRIIVVPEEMEFNWPVHAPAGTPVAGN